MGEKKIMEQSLEDKRLGEEIIKRFREAQRKVVTQGKRSKTVHASHITGPCILRTWYDFRNDPEPLTAQSVANFYVGQIVHGNSALGKKNEVHYGANIRTMKPIATKDINQNNLFDCVTGTCDDLIEWEGDLVIADKKTWSSLKIDYRTKEYSRRIKSEPDENYINQLNIYKLLAYICDGVEAKKGVLLYLDKATSFKDPMPFVFNLKPVDEIRSWVIDRLDKLRQLVEPEKTITKYCNYCPHLKTCDPPRELIPRWTS